MESVRRLLGLNKKKREQEKEKWSSFMENGSMLLEELMSSWNGRLADLRSFSAKEILMATNNFDSQHKVAGDSFCEIYEGTLGGRNFFVKNYNLGVNRKGDKSYAIRDIAITSQMSGHNNVLKLIGCCLEFQFPALIYEYSGHGGHRFLSDLIYTEDNMSLLTFSWKSRLKIANGIASAVLYLHTAFPRPIIHRDLKPTKVMVDEFGVAKLIDFSYSITIPDGESRVQDQLTGTVGFLDPEYFLTGFVTEKSDVYGFGALLLELLVGKRVSQIRNEFDQDLICWVKEHLVDNEHLMNQAVDPTILGGGTEQEQQLQAFVGLVSRCIQLNGDDRPEMLEVAQELRRIERYMSPPPSDPGPSNFNL